MVETAKVATKAKKKRTRPKTTRLGLLGHIAGGFFGPHGSDLGRAAGNAISRITGMGDYKVSENSVSKGNSVPTFMQGGSGVRICHREFLQDVTGSVAFTLQSYQINPGLSPTFPLLSQLAATFDEYDLRGLVFEYRPSSGTAVSSTSAALGVVIMATNYDSTDPLFVNKQQMESYEFSNSTVPFQGCIHPVECARNRNVLESLYVRTGNQTSGTDLRFCDLGVFQLATVGMQSAYVTGELWVSYDVYLRKPRLSISPALQSCFVWHVTTGPNNTSGTSALPFGSAPYYDGVDPRVSLVTNGSPSSILISAVGTYFLTIYITTAGVSFTGNLLVSAGSNISTVSKIQSRTTSGGGNPGTTLANQSWLACHSVNAYGTGAANYINMTFQSSTTVSVDVLISRLPGLLMGTRLPPAGLENLKAIRHVRDPSMDDDYVCMRTLAEQKE